MESGVDHDNEKHIDAQFNSLALPGLTARHWDIRRTIFKNSDLQGSRISKLEFMDVRLDQCKLANASWQEAAIFRSEFRSCRMTGINLSSSVIRHMLFEACDMKLSTLRFASFKDVRFQQCILSDADFQEADLTGAVFRDCDLTRVQMSGATLRGADIRGSRIDGIGGRPEDFKGVIIDETQFGILSWQFVKQFGIVVKNMVDGEFV
jgi:uncharacterized protein YjbI with pentapeptide repeats